MLTAHPDTFALVQIHLDAYGISWGYTRASFYSVAYTPTVWFDGLLEYIGTTDYEAIYQTRVAVPTDVTIALGAAPPDTQTTNVHADVCIESGGSGKTMRIYMVQVLDYWPPPAQEPNQRNGLKQAVTTQDITLAPGECQEVVRTFTFDSTSWADQENIKIIAWAQDDELFGPAEVYQAAIMTWPFPPADLPCDFDDNHVIDQSDAEAFIACYLEPSGPGCEEGDTEPDGDIDCDDWEILKSFWTGPPDYPLFFPECDIDCNSNLVADEFDIDGGTSDDCQPNGIPDECDIAVEDGGLCEGEDCSPDSQPNGVPDECDTKRPMAEDCSTISRGTRCNATGTCTTDADCWQESYCVPPPTDEPGSGVCYALKARILSIARHPEQSLDTARRVKLDDGTELGWVGDPAFVEPLQEPTGFWLATLQDTPHYETTWPDVVHVAGCQIAHAGLCDVSGVHCDPNACPEGETCVQHSYQIQALPYGFHPGEESNYSEVLELRTNSTWGDTVSTITNDYGKPPDGVVGINDIMAAIKKYQIVNVAPIVWIDIDPSDGAQVPEQIIGVGDIMKCIDGYQGKAYPGLGPLNCP